MAIPAECPRCHAPLTKRRSGPDHRRFFALLFAAFENWPETHEFQPNDSEHLRAWLLCKVGYREAITIPVPSADPAVMRAASVMAEAAFRAFASNSFCRNDGKSLVVERAKSISFAELDQRQFAPLRQAIEEVIQAETGIDTETFEAD